ncbi:hypothetical protein ACI1US_02424 [Leucobacter sp. BZR 635]
MTPAPDTSNAVDSDARDSDALGNGVLDNSTLDNGVLDSAAAEDDGPEHVPANAWVTMGIFAVFVIAFGTCASTFMFN